MTICLQIERRSRFHSQNMFGKKGIFSRVESEFPFCGEKMRNLAVEVSNRKSDGARSENRDRPRHCEMIPDSRLIFARIVPRFAKKANEEGEHLKWISDSAPLRAPFLPCELQFNVQADPSRTPC